MRFRIIGADKETGKEVDLTIEAGDARGAESYAERKQILVIRILPISVPVVKQMPSAFDSVSGDPLVIPTRPAVNKPPPIRNASIPVSAFPPQPPPMQLRSRNTVGSSPPLIPPKTPEQPNPGGLGIDLRNLWAQTTFANRAWAGGVCVVLVLALLL